MLALPQQHDDSSHPMNWSSERFRAYINLEALVCHATCSSSNLGKRPVSQPALPGPQAHAGEEGARLSFAAPSTVQREHRQATQRLQPLAQLHDR
jgi:hypothetical protein